VQTNLAILSDSAIKSIAKVNIHAYSHFSLSIHEKGGSSLAVGFPIFLLSSGFG
jgi:hypothetical protein